MQSIGNLNASYTSLVFTSQSCHVCTFTSFYFGSRMDSILKLIRLVVKVALHLLTRTSELERITKRYPANREYIIKEVRKSISRSKQLPHIRRRVCVLIDEFSVQDVVQNISLVKRFHNPGLVYAIASLRRTNVGIYYLKSLADRNFSKEYEPILEELWKQLKPNVQREGAELRSSKSWSDIGFQGFDPTTDFRGAGMLSLENLKYFASAYPETARRILNHQCVDITNGGFPFAITGINITHFLLSLATRHKLDDLFLFPGPKDSYAMQDLRTGAKVSDRLSGMSESTPLLLMEEEEEGDDDNDHNSREDYNEDKDTEQLALERFNMLYVSTFVLFAERWEAAAPRDAMEFPLVFGPFKNEIEAMVQTPQGMNRLVHNKEVV